MLTFTTEWIALFVFVTTLAETLVSSLVISAVCGRLVTFVNVTRTFVYVWKYMQHLSYKSMTVFYYMYYCYNINKPLQWNSVTNNTVIYSVSMLYELARLWKMILSIFNRCPPPPPPHTHTHTNTHTTHIHTHTTFSTTIPPKKFLFLDSFLTNLRVNHQKIV